MRSMVMGTDPSADPGVVSEEKSGGSAAAPLLRLQHQREKSKHCQRLQRLNNPNPPIDVSISR